MNAIDVKTIESKIRASRLLGDDDDANSEAAHIWFEIADRPPEGEQIAELLDSLVELLAHVCDEAQESGRRSGEALYRQGYEGPGGDSDCAWGTIIVPEELTTRCQELWAHLHEEPRGAVCDWARGLALSAEADELADLRDDL